MKIIISVLLLLFLSACVMTGGYHASGTLIGLEVGTPSVGSLSIGFRNFEVTVVGDESKADIAMTTKAGPNGLDTTKRTVFNGERTEEKRKN